MENHPKTFFDFEQRFPSEEPYFEYLFTPGGGVDACDARANEIELTRQHLCFGNGDQINSLAFSDFISFFHHGKRDA